MMLEKKDIIINDKKVFYWQGGANHNDVIVLLHGFPGNHVGLVNLSKALRVGRQVIIPDLPACGQSQDPLKKHGINDYADWLNDFLNELSISKAIIIGHSFGARIALSFAAHYASKVRFLVLITPIVKYDGLLDRIGSLRYKIAGWLPGTLRKKYFSSSIYEYIAAIFVIRTPNLTKRRRIIRQNVKEIKHLDYKVHTEIYKEIYKLSLLSLARAVKVKTLVIAGGKDYVATLDSIQELTNQFQNALLLVMKGAGHLLPVEKPLATAKIINHWLSLN